MFNLGCVTSNILKWLSGIAFDCLLYKHNYVHYFLSILRERSGSVVECLTRARHINPSLVLVQPRKTRPYITERLLMGRKESNQTNKNFRF